MTVADFNLQYGPEWVKLRSKPIFVALRAVIAAHSPAKLNAKRPPADVIAGGTLFFSENQGYEQLVELLEVKLGETPPARETTVSDYSEPEV